MKYAKLVLTVSSVIIITVFFTIMLRKSKYECKNGKCYVVDRVKSRESYDMLKSVEYDMKDILLKLSRERDCSSSIKDRIPYCLNNSTLSENIYKLMGSTSFTVDKKDVYLCLKDDNNKYYDKNLIMLVAIHEYAHILCNSQNHTPEFNKINRYVLGKAVSWGYYKPINFETNPVNYCGMDLKHNPI